MKILLIDTCGVTGSVAVADTDCSPTIVASVSLPNRTASERLIPSIKSLVESITYGLQTLEAVVVVHGPGSFTGVRVGLSAAKGLCEALGLPLIAISRLAVLAGRVKSPAAACVCALLDAGRGEFYFGHYVDEVCIREALLSPDELLAGSTGEPQLVVVCEASVANAVAALEPRLVAEPTAEDALPLALSRIQLRIFDDVATIDANYLRRTDAEIFAKPKQTAVAAPTDNGSQVEK